MSPELPRFDCGNFRTRNKEDFAEIYCNAEELMPHRIPTPRGRSVITTAYVDASHASNKVTRRSHSGYALFLNWVPAAWYSKRQYTVETSTVSSEEFIALKVCPLEAIKHLRFKLQCFGVPLLQGEPPTYVFCDNESAVRNTTKVESTLNKKHSSVAYHHCRWSVAAGVITFANISSHENIADCFTKQVTLATRTYLFGQWIFLMAKPYPAWVLVRLWGDQVNSTTVLLS